MYAKYLKRYLDFWIALIALIALSPVLIALTVIGAVKMKGNPFFTQERPGWHEKIFKLIKFRTMTNEKDKNGNLLSDEKRLTAYGKFLRSTSLDELPELLNVIKGDMSLIGPRPQLIRDMVFMTKKQRVRHTVRPGISGLAQINGRNAISWEDKLNFDLEYVKNVNFINDVKIVFLTFKKVFGRNETLDEIDITDDYGDALLKNGKISQVRYDELQKLAKKIIRSYENDKNG